MGNAFVLWNDIHNQEGCVYSGLPVFGSAVEIRSLFPVLPGFPGIPLCLLCWTGPWLRFVDLSCASD